jgi:hypothetical protein
MNTPLLLESVLRTARSHGKSSALYDVAFRGLNKCLYYRILQCLVIEDVNEQCMVLPPPFRFAKLEKSELLGFSRHSAHELTAGFIDSSLEKGDDCYAIIDGDILASYGWYSRRPTLLDNEDLMLRFNRDYVYMYKGLTLAAYRGQRLHAMGMTRALAAYKALGYKGLVSYVESNNFDSLRSCYRMGYRNCGQIRVARFAGKYFFRRQPSCDQFGLAVDRCSDFPYSV